MALFFGRKNSSVKQNKFQQLKDLPQQYCSKPIITLDDRIIIPTDKEFIYEYITNNNEWNNFCQYPNKEQLSGHSMCFNQQTQQLIIYDGKGKLIKINLDNPEHGQLQHIDVKTKDHCLCFMFNSTLNLIGGFKNNKHYSSNNNGQSFQEISTFNNIKNGIIGHSIIKLKQANKLLLMGGWDYYDNTSNYDKEIGNLFDSIWEFDNNGKEWKLLNDIKMPYKMCGFGYVKSRDEQFVIIFGGQRGNKSYLNEIYYLNLHSMSWTKSALKCPKKSGYHAIMKSNGNIHLFERVPAWKYGHYMINIKDIIPENELKDIESVVVLNNNKAIPIVNNFQQQPGSPKRSMADELEIKNDGEIERLNRRISSLERQLIAKDESINNLQTENQALRAEIDRFRQNDTELKRVNENLQDEHKELEIKYNELKIEYETLKSDRLDVKNYLDWKAKDVVEWIMSLENQRFIKYKDLLLNKFVKENVDGLALNEMDAGDLAQFGVNDFKDRKCLIKHIKSLSNNINVNINDNAAPMHDEDALIQQEGQNNTAYH